MKTFKQNLTAEIFFKICHCFLCWNKKKKKEWSLSSIFLASSVHSMNNFCLQGGQERWENTEGDVSINEVSQ